MTQLSDRSAEGKTDFSHLYHRPDPRGYYGTLFGELQYQTPQQGLPLFEAIRRAQHQTSPRASGTILDVCCSYGVNAALLSTDLTMSEIYDHYNSPELADLSPEQLAEIDQRFYADHRHSDAPEIVGFDIASEAVEYAIQAGLLADGWAANLEESEPSQAMVEGVQNVSLLVLTGGVGYITEHTFDRLMRAFPAGRKPWIAAFVLRTYPYDTITATLAEHGLVTERLQGATFPQRQFSEGEQPAALERLHSLGLDTRGLEDEGYYHTEFFLSRPAADLEALPLDQLLDTYR